MSLMFPPGLPLAVAAEDMEMVPRFRSPPVVLGPLTVSEPALNVLLAPAMRFMS